MGRAVPSAHGSTELPCLKGSLSQLDDTFAGPFSAGTDADVVSLSTSPLSPPPHGLSPALPPWEALWASPPSLTASPRYAGASPGRLGQT